MKVNGLWITLRIVIAKQQVVVVFKGHKLFQIKTFCYFDNWPIKPLVLLSFQRPTDPFLSISFDIFKEFSGSQCPRASSSPLASYAFLGMSHTGIISGLKLVNDNKNLENRLFQILLNSFAILFLMWPSYLVHKVLIISKPKH